MGGPGTETLHRGALPLQVQCPPCGGGCLLLRFQGFLLGCCALKLTSLK